MPKMTPAELADLLAREFPESDPSRSEIEALRDHFVRIRRHTGSSDLRPGGTISGPTMMALADYAMYTIVLAMIGPVPLAVTTHLSIDFLRKPEPGDLIAEATLLKLGRRLAVGSVAITSEGVEDVVAQASLTYSIPPR